MQASIRTKNRSSSLFIQVAAPNLHLDNLLLFSLSPRAKQSKTKRPHQVGSQQSFEPVVVASLSRARSQSKPLSGSCARGRKNRNKPLSSPCTYVRAWKKNSKEKEGKSRGNVKVTRSRAPNAFPNRAKFAIFRLVRTERKGKSPRRARSHWDVRPEVYECLLFSLNKFPSLLICERERAYVRMKKYRGKTNETRWFAKLFLGCKHARPLVRYAAGMERPFSQLIVSGRYLHVHITQRIIISCLILGQRRLLPRDQGAFQLEDCLFLFA